MDLHVEAASMLADARQHIEKVGWAKGSYQTSQGAVCLDRALSDVDGTKHGKEVDRECRRIILNLTGTTTIPTYNDKQTTTKDDVIDVLSAAEKIALELAQVKP